MGNGCSMTRHIDFNADGNSFRGTVHLYFAKASGGPDKIRMVCTLLRQFRKRRDLEWPTLRIFGTPLACTVVNGTNRGNITKMNHSSIYGVVFRREGGPTCCMDMQSAHLRKRHGVNSKHHVLNLKGVSGKVAAQTSMTPFRFTSDRDRHERGIST